MNISNALFSFTEQLVGAAGVGSALKDVQIQADVYEEIKSGKTIRVDDLRSANPSILPDGNIRRDNAIINVFFIAMPKTQALADRLSARQLSEDMSTEWLKAVFADPTLNHRVCLVGQISQFNDWIKPGTVKMPVTILRLRINPRGNS